MYDMCIYIYIHNIYIYIHYTVSYYSVATLLGLPSSGGMREWGYSCAARVGYVRFD